MTTVRIVVEDGRQEEETIRVVNTSGEWAMLLNGDDKLTFVESRVDDPLIRARTALNQVIQLRLRAS